MVLCSKKIIKNNGACDIKHTDDVLNAAAKDNTAARESFVRRFRGLPFIGLTATRESELNRLADAIDWGANSNVVGSDIYFKQLMYVIPYILCCVIAFCINPIGLFLLIGIPFVFNKPVKSLKTSIQADLQEISFQFPDFYDTVYVQYKDDNNILLGDIVQAYIPIASLSFKKVLKRFLLDLDGGEDQALEMLDMRYTGSPMIHKFCTVMRQRLKGDEASKIAMLHFREELQADVHDWMIVDLEHRKALADRVTVVMIMIILTIVLIVYFGIFVAMTL